MSSTPRRTSIRTTAFAIAIAVALVPVATTTAWADDGTNWWYDRYAIPDIQAAGGTGAGVQVAVIDAQINPDLPVFEGASLTVDPTPVCSDLPVTSADATDDAVHGSDVTALLVGNGSGPGAVRGIAPETSVVFYGLGNENRFCDEDDFNRLSAIGQGIDRAVADGARIISISQGMAGLNDADAEGIARALAAGVIIIAATPNSLQDPNTYPAAANGVVAVNAFDEAGAIERDSQNPDATNIWPETTAVAAGVDFPSVDWQVDSTITGSSLATPLVAGMLAVTWQKYPDATANQLIQSLILNTTPDEHPLRRDVTGGYGYGPASLRHLLAVDPTRYPDVNPLLDKSSGVPTLAQIASPAAAPTAPATSAPSSAEPTPIPTLTPTPIPTASDSASSGILGGVVIAVVVAVVLAAAVVVLVLRRRRAITTEGGAP